MRERLHADERELRRDEEAVEEDQQDDDEQVQCCQHGPVFYNGGRADSTESGSEASQLDGRS